MKVEDLFLESEIQSNIKFDKEMKTVFELSYFLIDFQAVINSMSEIIYDDVDGKNQIIEDEHPMWQKKIEKSVESYLFQSPEAAANGLSDLTIRLKQTTNRNFNRKYQTNLQLKDFSKGSLVLGLANSLVISLITEFIKSVLVKQTGNENIINIDIKNNFIYIDGSVMKIIPKNSCIEKAIHLNIGNNQGTLDAKKCIHDIVETAQPDQDLEESVKRFLQELQKNGIVSERVSYDSRGIKTVVRDIERLTGHFVDMRV